ncbi:hypothetical protein BDK88_0094 [Natrinema hispanicum]|uniref:Uncharacterized protein n=1 Tax=Natrinema hispanicum TaxID=392421 RepID=A0A482YF74_9EURY|nr:hypothetical protein BDK88_0094 [Natrinema hispanicum]
MADGRRMSTVRFYGSIEDRMEILTELLSLLTQNEEGVPRVGNRTGSSTGSSNTNTMQRMQSRIA